MLIPALKKIYNLIAGTFAAYMKRLERKNDNPRGYIFGSPKEMRKKITIFAVIVLFSALLAIFIKQGAFVPSSVYFDRETAPGVKLPSNLSGTVRPQDILFEERLLDRVGAPVDCDRLLATLKSKGSLSEKELIDFNAFCKKFLTTDMQNLIDELLSSGASGEVVAEILKKAETGKVSELVDFVKKDDVRAALKTVAGKSVAENLDKLLLLSPDEAKRAFSILSKTPDNFKNDALKSVLAVAGIENADARKDMFDVLESARSKEELDQITDFAETIAKGTGQEQGVLAKAFKVAPDFKTRQNLTTAAKEVLAIDAADPVRGKLVEMIRQTSELPPERQAEAYGRIGQVANVYRTTTDPNLKRALAAQIMAAQSPDDIIALGERLDLLAKAEAVGPIDVNDKIAVISGNDPEFVDKLKATVALADAGNLDEARKILSGNSSPERIAEILRTTVNSPSVGGVPTSQDIKSEISAISKLKSDSSEIKKEIDRLLASGINVDDPEIVNLYKKLFDINSEISDRNSLLDTMKERFKTAAGQLKERAAADFAQMGITQPIIDFEIPQDFLDSNEPLPRFYDLDENPEFWGVDSFAKRKYRTKSYKFTTGDGSEGSQNELLGQATKDTDSWYVDSFGAGSQGGTNSTRNFEISRTMLVPGILRRVPASGIPSANANKYNILFEFIVSVANRRTGKIEIPAGSIAICKPREVDEETGRMSADCDTVDVGGREDIRVSLTLADPTGADGVPGRIVDNRGWQLAGIFLTAFSASVIDGFSEQALRPYEARATKTAADFVSIGSVGGASSILQNVADKQIESWSKASVFWHSFDGALATVRQK